MAWSPSGFFFTTTGSEIKITTSIPPSSIARLATSHGEKPSSQEITLSLSEFQNAKAFFSSPNSGERDHDEGFATSCLTLHSLRSILTPLASPIRKENPKSFIALAKVFRLQGGFIASSNCFTRLLGKVMPHALMLPEQSIVISFKSSFPSSIRESLRSWTTEQRVIFFDKCLSKLF